MGRKAGSDSAKTVESIVSAAQALLASEGEAALTLRRVARDAGVSMGTIGYYFPDREVLLEACLDVHHRWLREHQARFVAMLAEGVPLRTVIERAVRSAYVAFREDRETLRARRIMALQRGELDPSRRAESLEPALAAFAGAWSSMGIDARRARLVAQSVLFEIVRYCLLSDDELCELTQTDDVNEARRAVEDHLVFVFGALWDAAMTEPKPDPTA